MLRLRDIMTTEIVTLDPNLTIREAMDTFASKRISGAPVVEGAVVVGVVSATDLLQFAASLPGVPTERDSGVDILEDASGEVSDSDRFPNEDRDDPSALFFTDLWDDAGATVVERMAVPATAEWNFLEEHTVSEAMTRAPVHSLTPETLVTVAADYMRRERIHRVLVMKDRALLGLVTTSDITEAVADGKLTAHTYVFDPPRRSPMINRWPRRR
ncbi:MAG TPA: CBS domain-containing protein [Gemmatimonadaceae bacterium]|nr:CBS domain-containing protein [Gemmatimonadaceae bacterium]